MVATWIAKGRALLADAQEYLAAASPRERRLVAGAAGGAALFVLLITTAAFSSAISTRSDALQERRLDWDKVQALARTYGQHEQERQLLEARLRAPGCETKSLSVCEPGRLRARRGRCGALPGDGGRWS